ncbi:YhdP family protein [Chromobacterium subtsugae]|uniref:YhdP family protein n=1 Tax=Chromobacterium subtsugae TaxID=251747 RepID=UPI000A7F62E6|nr:YhdP family protein [Chromobacterium subtsugae]MBW7566981.1 TIGR02099 family protein [Chromobacterium subtsugae]WSE90074.1 YhdP family protein [Chromobacterium subtsugae]WVH58446.1 YhdP family protein [Chromobacterium subtsugae]
MLPLSRIHVLRVLKRSLLVLALLLSTVCVLLTAAFCAFTFWLLPNLDQYRPRLEQSLSGALGHDVRIAKLSGHWEGVAPLFELSGVAIANPVSGQALTLSLVTVQPSWTSMLAWEPRLSVLVNGPAVELRRTAAGVIYLNGFDLSSGPSSDNALGNWLLRQPSLDIRNARLSWQDDRLGLPRLDLKQGQLLLERTLLGHRLHLAGLPAATLGKGFELDASWRGDDINSWLQWSGSLRVALNGARADVWSRYMREMGVLRSGEGDGTLEMSFADGSIGSLRADVNVRNAAYTPPSARELVLPQLQGKLQLDRQGDGSYKILASDLTLASATGLAFDKSSIKGQWRPGAQGGGELTLDNVDVGHLNPFIRALGVDANPLFARFSPRGALHGLTLGWQGPAEAPRSFQLKTRFEALGWQPFADLPGVAGVTGSIDFNEQGGRLLLDTGKSEVIYPALYAQSLPFDSLAADISWRQRGAALDIDFDKLAFASADLAGRLQGSYHHGGGGAGHIDLTASVDEVKATRIPGYLPHQVGEHTSAWLRKALLDGVAKNVRLTLKGDLDQFPFPAGKGGEFLVEADVEKAKLLYQPGWPAIDDIDAKLTFHNEAMRVESTRASTVGVPLRQVRVGIDQLGATAPWLKIEGEIDDKLDRMLAFTTKSPVDGWLGGFTGKIRAAGPAALKLQLAVPLAGEDSTKVRGDIDFKHNRLLFTQLPLPELTAVQGRLTFTERGIDSKGVAMEAFGGAFRLSAHTGADKRMRFEVGGEADGKRVLQQYLAPLAPLAEGRSRFDSQFVVRDGLESLQLSSSLQGLALDAPPPLGKAAAAAQALQLQLHPAPARFGQAMRLEFALGTALNGKLRLDEHGNLQAGALGLERDAGEWPATGLVLRAQQARVDLDDWWQRLSRLGGADGLPNGNMILSLDLDAPELSAQGFTLHQVNAHVFNRPGTELWSVKLRSREATGLVSYQPGGGGALEANLDRLALNWPLRADAAPTPGAAAKPQLPAMKIHIAELSLQGREIGKLDMTARRDGAVWIMDPLKLTTPEGSLSGSAEVNEQGAGSVDSRFALETANAGKLLARFGQGDVFRNGQGKLSGQLNWPGGLSDLDAAHLSGQLSLDFKNGRFAKVDPGVARLLGVLSLQSLPRRIRLDFTDVFSEGFAFDTLQGAAGVRNGLFTSSKVEMRSPAAEVTISGEVDLGKETQALKVHVVPHVAESVALAAGAALLNPVVGIATLAAQKVLQDPVGKILSLDYAVSGSLKDPQVVRVNVGDPVNIKGKKP